MLANDQHCNVGQSLGSIKKRLMEGIVEKYPILYLMGGVEKSISQTYKLIYL